MISIIIPVKDCPYLGECLPSFIPNKSEFQIVLVDDNSENWEENRMLYEKYKTFLNIRYTHLTEDHEKSCLYPVREGLKLASGDYIKIIGADDWLEPYAIDFEYDYLSAHEDYYDAMLTSYIKTDDKLRPMKNGVYLVHRGITLDMMKTGCYITDYMLTKKYFFDMVKFREDVGSRWLWIAWYEMLSRGMRICSLPETITLRYRQHKGNLSCTDGYLSGQSKLPMIFKEIDDALLPNRDKR